MDIIIVTGLTYILFQLAKRLFKRYPTILLHPLITVTLSIILVITLFSIPVQRFEEGGRLLKHMLAPATISFAIPVYKHFETVKKYFTVMFFSIFISSLVAIFSTLILGLIFKLEDELLLSLLPRSITTPLAIEMSSSIGGVPALSIAFVIITGFIGVIFADRLFDLLKIKSPIARGLALGMGAHAVGTNHALTYGEEATTFSTLAMIFAGIITIIFGLTFIPWLMNLII